MPNKFTAYSQLTLAMFIAGSSVVASKMMLVQTFPIFLASEFSLIIALIILLPLTYAIKQQIPRIDQMTLLILFFQSVTGVFLFRSLLFLGLKYTSAIESGLITSSSPAIVGILAHFILKEKLCLNRVIGIVLVVTGILIINICNASNSYVSNANSIKGNSLVILAIICESLFSILSKKNKYPIPSIYRTTIITMFSILCFIPFSIYDILHYNFSSLNSTASISVLYYGVFVSVISYILWFKGIEKIPASNAAVFTGIMPISSILLSGIILKEKLSSLHIISLIFIILGICVSCSNIINLLISKPKTNIHGADTEISLTNSTIDLKMNERRLWIDHISWTRSFIVSDVAPLPDKDDVAQRLLRNQDDIGSSIKPYYGEEAGNKLSKLLRDHILIASQVVDAAKSNNIVNIDKYNKIWYKNADDIADFLSSANPNLSNSELKDMLHKHLDLVTTQVASRIKKDWKADIDAYDKGEDHMIKFADMLSDGIIKQFPDKFK